MTEAPEGDQVGVQLTIARFYLVYRRVIGIALVEYKGDLGVLINDEHKLGMRYNMPIGVIRSGYIADIHLVQRPFGDRRITGNQSHLRAV